MGACIVNMELLYINIITHRYRQTQTHTDAQTNRHTHTHTHTHTHIHIYIFTPLSVSSFSAWANGEARPRLQRTRAGGCLDAGSTGRARSISRNLQLAAGDYYLSIYLSNYLSIYIRSYYSLCVYIFYSY